MDAKAATPVKARRPQLPVVTPQPEARPLKRRPSLGRLSFTLLSRAASPRPESPRDLSGRASPGLPLTWSFDGDPRALATPPFIEARLGGWFDCSA